MSNAPILFAKLALTLHTVINAQADTYTMVLVQRLALMELMFIRLNANNAKQSARHVMQQISVLLVTIILLWLTESVNLIAGLDFIGTGLTAIVAP